MKVSLKFPQLIEPAYSFRNILRKKVVNPTFWKRREKTIREKIKNSKGANGDDVKNKITFSIRSVRQYHNKYFGKNGGGGVEGSSSSKNKKVKASSKSSMIKVSPKR